MFGDEHLELVREFLWVTRGLRELRRLLAFGLLDIEDEGGAKPFEAEDIGIVDSGLVMIWSGGGGFPFFIAPQVSCRFPSRSIGSRSCVPPQSDRRGIGALFDARPETAKTATSWQLDHV